MSDRPSSPLPTLSQLRAECHRLVDAVSHRPGSMKLMIGIHRQLQLFAGYKANRRALSRPP
ncbi:MAG TPA: hypothetical protein V6D34_13275 [Candidatus Sericytochromatia bacterium]|jgi:hypothetical protein